MFDVGQVDLPDAVNTITWKKIDGNQTFGSSEKYRVEEVIRYYKDNLGWNYLTSHRSYSFYYLTNIIITFIRRENAQVLGAFLFINKLEESDYGRYMCSISNTDDQIVQQFTNITKPGKLI